MEIFFIASEVHPFSKVGGLGDVVSALPAALAKKGVTVKTITPAYRSVQNAGEKLEKTKYIFDIKLGSKSYDCSILRWISPENPKHQIYFIQNTEFFYSRNVYTDENGAPYPDNDERFLLLQKAAMELMILMDAKPDIIHCHDNHAALVPLYLKTVYKDVDTFQSAKTVLTLHNIGYQGICSMQKKSIFKLPDEMFYPRAPMEWFGNINPLKAGIVTADKVTTVSPGHAREISEDDTFAAGLRPVLQARNDEVKGILNGVDYTEWNPETDALIYEKYTNGELAGKRKNKLELLRECGLSVKLIEKPLIGMVTRLVEQKGIDLIVNAFEKIMALDFIFIILGSGEGKYHRAFQEKASRYSEKFHIDFDYNVPLSHKIMAGSDIFLVPSRYEPCGITQMYALKYGAVPVVRNTGGLADTIVNWDGKKGNGFKFENYQSDSLVNILATAAKTFHNKQVWKKIIGNGIKADFSWERSAEKYIELYRSL